MTPSRMPRQPANLVPRWTGFGLVVLACSLAAIHGCGGGKPADSGAPAAGSTGTPGTATPPPAPAPETTPTTGTGASAADLGPKVFAQKCALCHGPDGHGNGPGSAALNPKPRNFHDKAYMATRTDAQLLEVITNGKGAMPKWGALLSDAEKQAVLAHIRGLGKKP